MAIAHKQKNGKWMCTGYNRHLKQQKRFYGRTKGEAELKAREFSERSKQDIAAAMPFYEAATAFLEERERVLSPNTIRGYTGILRALQGLHGDMIGDMDTRYVQRLINDLAGQVSPKTVYNRYSFIKSVLEYHNPEIVLRVKLPEKEQDEIVMPSEDEIKRILEAVNGNVLEVPVLLALFAPMRRGEISALNAADIAGNVIHVRAAIAKGADGKLSRKAPKTASGDRFVPMPSFVIEKLPKEGAVTPLTPDAITRRFERLMKQLDIDLTFHQLRHWSVSYLHQAGLSDQEILSRAGWKDSKIFRQIYRHVISGNERAVPAFEQFGRGIL